MGCRLTLTREFAFASGSDAATIRMHKAGRTRWTREEASLAAATTNRLLLNIPAEHGGLGGLKLSPKQLADLGLSA